jgi:hypothetical protein
MALVTGADGANPPIPRFTGGAQVPGRGGVGVGSRTVPHGLLSCEAVSHKPDRRCVGEKLGDLALHDAVLKRLHAFLLFIVCTRHELHLEHHGTRLQPG